VGENSGRFRAVFVEFLCVSYDVSRQFRRGWATLTPFFAITFDPAFELISCMTLVRTPAMYDPLEQHPPQFPGFFVEHPKDVCSTQQLMSRVTGLYRFAQLLLIRIGPQQVWIHTIAFEDFPPFVCGMSRISGFMRLTKDTRGNGIQTEFDQVAQVFSVGAVRTTGAHAAGDCCVDRSRWPASHIVNGESPGLQQVLRFASWVRVRSPNSQGRQHSSRFVTRACLGQHVGAVQRLEQSIVVCVLICEPNGRQAVRRAFGPGRWLLTVRVVRWSGNKPARLAFTQ